MGQFVNSIEQVAKNYKKYDAWEQNQANIRVRKEALANENPLSEEEKDRLKQRTETVIRAAEIMDARSEDNCENMEQVTSMIAVVPAVGLAMAQAPITQFAVKRIYKKYSERLSNLPSGPSWRDTPEQIKAKRNLKQKLIKEAEKKRDAAIVRANTIIPIAVISASFLSAIFMILWGNRKQKEASRIGRYQAKQNELKGLENFVVYTPEQIEQAQKIAETLPDVKEKKSLSKMISELKAIHKDKDAYNAWLAQKDPDELEKLKKLDFPEEAIEQAKRDKELIVNVVKDVNIKAEEYSENLENAFDTFSTLSWIAAIPIGFGLNSILKALKTGPKIRNIASVTTPLLISLGIGLYGTIAQKQASRVGRYKARRELIDNPAVLTNYSDEDMERVKDIKAKNQKTGFFKKIGQNFKFLTTYFKDKKEYNKYKKEIKKQNEKLQKAFKDIEITDAQKADAKLLQTNVFKAFDEVDEMSQRFSEDVEAGCEIAKESVSTVWTLGTTAAMALAAISLSKGKLPIMKWGNKITNWTFNNDSSIKKGINNLYETLNKRGKEVTKEFQEALVKGEITSFLEKPENAEIKQIVKNLSTEFENITQAGLQEGLQSQKGVKEGFTKALSNHLKQTKIAKWLRGLMTDILKLKAKSKAEEKGIELTKDIKEVLGLDFSYKNYKTLINTCIAGFVPILGVLFGVPFAFNAWLTNIQKKAGKIGVMQAVDNLDDPKVFADTNKIA